MGGMRLYSIFAILLLLGALDSCHPAKKNDTRHDSRVDQEPRPDQGHSFAANYNSHEDVFLLLGCIVYAEELRGLNVDSVKISIVQLMPS